jgi:hypothetical protein
MEHALTATLSVSGAQGNVTYTSSNTKVATVADGTIKAISGGEAIITVYAAGNDEYKADSAKVSVTVIPVPSLDPVTWNLTSASYTENGSFSEKTTNVFVSTDGTNAKLTYVAGSGCKIENNKQMKMGGATQYGSTPNRYFILPSISGSGTLSVEFGDNANTVKVVTTVEKNAAAIASLDGDDPKVELSGLDASTKYYLLMDTKSYFKTITWTPNAAAADEGDTPDTPTPEDPEEEEATAKVIYDWASKVGTSRYVSETITGNVKETTVKIKGTSTNCVSFGKTLSTGDTLKVKPDFCMVIKPAEGTFLKGDTIHITGCYSNKSTKTSTIVFYYGTQKLFGTEQFANTYDGETVPTEQLLVLEQDCDSICLGREGNTSTCVTALTVVRPASATIKGDVNNDGSVTMADANMVVNYFLAEDKDSISGFNKEAGDVNKDGDISMADANAIVNIFLSGNTQ